MPKGKHKGGKRTFTNFEELESRKLKEQKEKEWRKARGDDSESGEDENEEKKKSSDESETESEEEESSSDEEERQPKAKGVSSLIEIENPNHIAPKMKKLSVLDTNDSLGKPQLSRKEKEELQKQNASANYRKLHAQGKTDEAKADMERLAKIKKQREEAKIRKEEEQKAKEQAVKSKQENTAKALSKKTSKR